MRASQKDTDKKKSFFDWWKCFGQEILFKIFFFRVELLDK